MIETLEELRRRLRSKLQRRRLSMRRDRLLQAYANVGKRRYGLGPGFTPTLFAYCRLEDEGLATVTKGGELEWHWPDEDGEAQ